MENITHPKSKSHRLLFFLLLLVFLSIPKLYAQKIVWETASPSISNTIIGTYSDPLFLNIKFSVGESELTASSIKVTLPNGITFKSVDAGEGNASGITFTGNVSGQDLILTPSSTSIPMGTIVHLKVNFTAEACNESTASLVTEILSNGVLATDGKKSANVNVRHPEIRVAPVSDVVNVPKGGSGDFTLNIDVTNQLKATSFKVLLNIDQYTILSNFTLDGVAVPTANIEIKDGVAAITLDQSLAGWTPIAATKKALKFTAQSDIGGTRIITLSGKYPAIEVPCVTTASNRLGLSYPPIPGIPNFVLPADKDHRRWVSASNLDGPELNMYTGVIMNGVDASYQRLSYRNDGTAGAIQVTSILSARRSTPYDYAYIDTMNIKYSIDKG